MAVATLQQATSMLDRVNAMDLDAVDEIQLTSLVTVLEAAENLAHIAYRTAGSDTDRAILSQLWSMTRKASLHLSAVLGTLETPTNITSLRAI